MDNIELARENAELREKLQQQREINKELVDQMDDVLKELKIIKGMLKAFIK